ncbi:MAG TPA: sugar phosphate isomerase/epimerase family protein [Candidatus Limnocylindrales bacterium]
MTVRTTAPTIACHAWAFGRMGYPAALRHIASRGFAAVDLPVAAMDSPGSVALDQLADPRAIERFRDDLDRNGLQLTDVFLLFPTATNDPDGRAVIDDVFARGADAIAALGSPGITISPGSPQPGEDVATSRARSVEVLAALLSRARASSIALSIEPHVGSITERPAEARQLVADVPGLQVTLDYSHFIYLDCDQASVEPLHAVTRHVHVRQSRPGRLAAPVDEGTIDFARVFDLLAADGYRGAVTVEYADSPWMGQDQLDVAAETDHLAGDVRRLIGQRWEGFAS